MTGMTELTRHHPLESEESRRADRAHERALDRLISAGWDNVPQCDIPARIREAAERGEPIPVNSRRLLHRESAAECGRLGSGVPRKGKSAVSGYPSVYRTGKHGRVYWRSVVNVPGVKIITGSCRATPEEAARDRDDIVREHGLVAKFGLCFRGPMDT